MEEYGKGFETRIVKMGEEGKKREEGEGKGVWSGRWGLRWKVRKE